MNEEYKIDAMAVIDKFKEELSKVSYEKILKEAQIEMMIREIADLKNRLQQYEAPKASPEVVNKSM